MTPEKKDRSHAFSKEYDITMQDGTKQKLNAYQIGEIVKLSPHSVIKRLNKGNRRIESFYQQKTERPFVIPTQRARTYFRD